MFALFDLILENKQTFPSDMSFSSGNLLKIADWARQYKKDKDYPFKPGDMVVQDQNEIKLTPSFVPALTLKHFKKIKSRSNSQTKPPYQIEHKLDNLLTLINHMADKYYKKAEMKHKQTKKRGPKTKTGRKTVPQSLSK